MKAMTEVSTDELAGIAGVAPQTVRDLASRGIFVRTRRGRFDRETSMKNYLAHLRREKSGKRGGGAAFASAGETTPNERSRLAAAQADAQELKNKIALGKLVDASEVESTWASIVISCRDAVLAAPARIASDLPHLTPYDLTVVDKHLRMALTRLESDGAP
jgi:terminase small subunit / prophage DNA-packing protein